MYIDQLNCRLKMLNLIETLLPFNKLSYQLCINDLLVLYLSNNNNFYIVQQNNNTFLTFNFQIVISIYDYSFFNNCQSSF